MRKLKALLVCMLLVCSRCGADKDCSIMEEGTFLYLDDIGDPTAFFTMRDGRHFEYHREKRYTIESNVTWINPCEYELEMVSSNFEDFPFQKGERIRIRIDAIRGDTILYSATVGNEPTWKSRILKVGN